MDGTSIFIWLWRLQVQTSYDVWAIVAPVDEREGGLIDALMEFIYADHSHCQSQKVTSKVWSFMFNQQPEPPYGRIEMQMCTLLGLLYVSEPVWVVSRFVVWMSSPVSSAEPNAAAHQAVASTSE